MSLELVSHANRTGRVCCHQRDCGGQYTAFELKRPFTTFATSFQRVSKSFHIIRGLAAIENVANLPKHW